MASTKLGGWVGSEYWKSSRRPTGWEGPQCRTWSSGFWTGASAPQLQRFLSSPPALLTSAPHHCERARHTAAQGPGLKTAPLSGKPSLESCRNRPHRPLFSGLPLRLAGFTASWPTKQPELLCSETKLPPARPSCARTGQAHGALLLPPTPQGPARTPREDGKGPGEVWVSGVGPTVLCGQGHS